MLFGMALFRDYPCVCADETDLAAPGLMAVIE
jgi:hypothetical protein